MVDMFHNFVGDWLRRRNSRISKRVERYQGERWEVVRFNTSLWASMNLLFFCYYQLGLTLSDYNLFL